MPKKSASAPVKNAKKATPVSKSDARRVAELKKGSAKKGKRAAKPSIKKNKDAPVAKLSSLGKEGVFNVSITMNDTVVEGRTDSIVEALLSAMPDKLNTKVIFHISLADQEDGKVVERVLNVPMARLLFNNKLRAQLFEKAMKLGLGYVGV